MLLHLLSRRHAVQWLAAFGLVMLGWLAPGLGQVASAQTATVCHAAANKGTDGPIDFGAYCWIDFSSLSLTQARSGSGQNFRVDLRGGAYLTFTLRIVPGNTAGNNMYAVGVPSWSGAAFGNSAFNNIPGKPILYQDQANQDGPRDTVTLSSLTLHANGSTELPFVFVAADGESSNENETLSFSTTGQPWALVSAPGISNPSRNMPVLNPTTPVGSSTGSQLVTISGTAAGSAGEGSYVFTTNNSPGTVTATMLGGGLQGVLFGLKYHTIGLSLTKTHVGDFTAGGTGTYTINIANTVKSPEINPPTEPQPVRVVDTLPTGLTYASATGTGWTCTNVGQVVTCNTTALQDLTTSRTFPPITIGVNVASSAPSSVINQAEVSDPTTSTLVFNVCETAGNGVCPNSATSSTGDPTAILDPAPASSGNKRLYLAESGGTPVLTRNRPNGPTTATVGNVGDVYFPLPPLAAQLKITNPVTVTLRGRRGGNGSANRRIRVQLYRNGTAPGNSISPLSGDMNFNMSGYTNLTQSLTSSVTTFQPGDRIILRLESRDNRDVELIQADGANYSFVELDASTVIHVDSIGFHAVPYTDPNPDQPKAAWEPGETVFIRADVSDPFGGFDVSAANSKLTLVDADGGPAILNGVSMIAKTSPLEGDGVANRILEYAYTIPPNASIGKWTATVTASEGLENIITHPRNESFNVVPLRLTIAKSHVGDFVAGKNNDYVLVVSNGGSAIAAGTTTTVKDTLASGLSFVSGTGTGWACAAVGQVVTCTSTAAVPAGGNMAPITLTVAVAGSMGTSVDNQASVGNSSVAGGIQKPGNVDTATIRHPDLSGSTMSVSDPNGGDVVPGEPLIYTITLTESAGVPASNVTVTDGLPANTTGLTVVSVPSGSVDASTGSQLSVSGITVPANGSVAIVLQVTVANVAPGSIIENTATVTNPAGPGASPHAGPLTVLQSQVAPPAEGSKFLYLLDNNTVTRDRDLTGTSSTIGVIIGPGVTQTWTLAPELAADLMIEGNASINVRANCTSGNFLCAIVPGSLTAQLWYNGTQIGSTSSAGAVGNTGVATIGLSIPITAPHLVSRSSGAAFELRIRNASGWSTVRVYEFNGGRSTASFLTSTVVNVDSVGIYAVPQSTGNAQNSHYVEGDTIYVRAVASDPFGSADITSATLELSDAQGNKVVNGAAMAVVVSSAGTKTFEYGYPVPPNPNIGTWTAKVTAVEGRETDPVISHHGSQLLSVHGKVSLTKAWAGDGVIDGDAIALEVGGGSSAVLGSSTAPSTVVVATATAGADATLTLSESFTSGSPGNYTPSLTCTKASDSSAVPVTGSGLSRTITMPADSAVACIWTNTWTVPLTVVKFSTVISDPVNGTTSPKAIPGAVVEYQIIIANPASNPIDTGTVFVTDTIPVHTMLRVADLPVGGPGPVSFTDGAPASGLTYGFTSLASTGDDIEFSSDDGLSWSHVPSPDPDGYDADVDAIRINPKGVFNAKGVFDPQGPQFTLKFRVKIL